MAQTVRTSGTARPGITRRKRRAIVIATLVVFLSLSGLYLEFAWDRYRKSLSTEAVMLAQSMKSLLHPEHIAGFAGNESDVVNPEYEMTKDSLIRLVDTANPIRFAYLFGERDGQIVFLLDSEPPESEDYSPPGQVYTEATEEDWRPFRTGETILTAPATDRWGTWISALVPVTDPVTGQIIAVLGIDYSADEWNLRLWNQMIPDFAIVACLLAIWAALLYTWSRHLALREASRQLAIDEALYHSVFDQAPIGIAVVNDKSFAVQDELGHVSINPMFERILGRQLDVLEEVRWPDITHPDDLQADIDLFDQFKAGEITDYALEKRFVRPDGSSVWTHMKVSPFLGGSAAQSMHLCLIEDISRRKAAEDSLRESERNKALLLANIPGMAYRSDFDRVRTMRFVSSGCHALTGCPPESLLRNKERSFNDVIAPEYREQVWSEWKKAVADKAPFDLEYEIVTADGNRKWVWEIGEGVYNEQGDVEALEGIIIDISDRKAFEHALTYQSEHDIGTGLLNGFSFGRQIRHDADLATKPGATLVGVNLSTVQAATSSYGFAYTQGLLKKVADRLATLCLADCTLYCVYGFLFVFYVQNHVDDTALSAFYDAVQGELATLLAAERINGGLGVVKLRQDLPYDADVLIHNVLVASERAITQTDHDFSVCVFDEQIEADIAREQEIRRALTEICMGADHDGLSLQYQPILDLRSGRMDGFEALARMDHNVLGRISPLEFIPIAEKAKLILPMGKIIVQKAFRFLQRLEENGYPDITVSINVSIVELVNSSFCRDLATTMEEMRIRPERVNIEVTESVFSSDYETINSVLSELKRLGLHIAIDDFGTGYSSLARERILQVDCLKIDKSFIDDLVQADPERAITRDIISMAHRLGHYVIAEGVELEVQRQYLVRHGCDKIQGYLISRPLDEDAAIKQLDTDPS